jgi:hypothetical protein
MQQRRLRPGDVLDDYCPRERRITDHAIVAMIDDEIKQTRCVSCDTEHEYKQAKVPPQRRKKAPAGLFTQVLDGLQGPARIAPNAGAPSPSDLDDDAPGVETPESSEPHPNVLAEDPADRSQSVPPLRERPRDTDDLPEQKGDRAEEGPVRRPLIRAQLPRPEGQQPPARDLPDFTIRQPSSGRSNRPGGQGPRGRRRSGGQPQGTGGPMRFGNQSRSNQFGRSSDRRHGGGRPGQGRGQGPGHGQGQGSGHGQGGRPNRGGRRGGGKKH